MQRRQAPPSGWDRLRPPVIIVSGAPGAGKTTLARRLSSDLRLPLLERDALKEALGDAMGHPDAVAASARLGAGSYAVLTTVLARLLEAGVGAVVESNFRRGTAEDLLRPLVGGRRSALLHCTAPDEVIVTRYRARFVAGLRHPVHLDADREPALRADLAQGLFRPLDLGIPVLAVDTADGWRPAYAEVVAFARRSLGAAPA